jgi:HlyD family secretion protein
MNGNINILVDSKENALVIPAEALIVRNGKKYVMVPGAEAGAAPQAGTQQQGTQSNQGNTGNAQSTRNNQGYSGNGQSTRNNQGGYGQSGTGNTQRQRTGTNQGNWGGTAAGGKLVEIKTGLENENYIEVLEGITEGQQILIALPQSTTTTNTNNNRNNMGGFGNFGGAAGGARSQGNNGGQR